MPDRAEGKAWLSAHLFFDGPIYSPVCDHVITDLVAPFTEEVRARGIVERFFFLRYSENGSHVRLRLFGETETLERSVRPILLDRLARQDVDRRANAAGSATPPVRVQWAPYEPEVHRYGGVEGIDVAETFFCDSSRTCIELLRTVGEDQSARLGKALLVMTVLLHTFCEDRPRAAEFAGGYRAGYLRVYGLREDVEEAWLDSFDAGWNGQAERLRLYIEAAWDRLDTGGSISDTLDRYLPRIRATRDQLLRLVEKRALVGGSRALERWTEALNWIFPSYLHMTNNRLGVRIREEMYLAHLLQRTLGEPVPASE